MEMEIKDTGGESNSRWLDVDRQRRPQKELLAKIRLEDGQVQRQATSSTFKGLRNSWCGW
jgi:hypothetical protein